MKRSKSKKIKEKQKAVKKAARDIKLLEKGFVPKRTKIGTSFKGKNKIIVGK
ncbi:MAG: hypothetical protein J7J38_00165 [Candidatus Aenigmarchaeota archaeon]|nr:hypothetical protein [Candidatus Aenigmarchaeota archaeon]